MASMSPPTEAVGQARRRRGRSALPAALLRKRGHSVVVGAGPAAFVLARRLAATRPTVLVGSRIGSDVASRDAVRVVDGDPTDEATLRAAGVRGAAGVFALDNSGAVNASVALLVRSLNQAGVAVTPEPTKGTSFATLRARRLGVDRHNGYRLDFFSIEDAGMHPRCEGISPPRRSPRLSRTPVAGSWIKAQRHQRWRSDLLCAATERGTLRTRLCAATHARPTLARWRGDRGHRLGRTQQCCFYEGGRRRPVGATQGRSVRLRPL